MQIRKKWTLLLGVAFAGLVAVVATAADEPKKADGEPIVILDSLGKEQKIKTWKITTGTRRLAWLAPAEKEPDPKDKPDPKEKPAAFQKAPMPKAKPATGPEALEFREENSTNWVNGIMTLVPMERLRSLEYDNMAQTVKLIAATGPKAEDTATLTGLTKFKDNKLVIEAEVDKGDLGIAELKFLGGVAKGGISGIKFPATAKIEAAPMGRTAVITTKADSKGKSTHRVADLQPLYRVGNGETLSPLVFFKKTLKIDVAKISKIVVSESGNESVWVVTLKAGGDESLSLLTTPMLDGKPATLEGFIGRVPVGYKLFPIHVIEEIEFDPKPKIELE